MKTVSPFPIQLPVGARDYLRMKSESDKRAVNEWFEREGFDIDLCTDVRNPPSDPDSITLTMLVRGKDGKVMQDEKNRMRPFKQMITVGIA